jgi:20S proteasome subunit beta 6
MQDAQGLLRLVELLVGEYEWQQSRSIGTEALARLLSNYLYYRRDFPFYTHNIVAGLDGDGAGAVYWYDSIGSFERVQVRLLLPLFGSVLLRYVIVPCVCTP